MDGLGFKVLDENQEIWVEFLELHNLLCEIGQVTQGQILKGLGA